MKRLIVIFVALAVAVTAVAQSGEPTKQGAHLKFESAKYDFGTVVRRGENLVHEFQFVNSGTEPVVVLSVTTSCSCLRAEYSRKPIAVGESGAIRIVLEPHKVERGVFHRVIQVRSNSIEGVNLLTVQGRAE